jgi:hypothetical protein
VNSSIETGLGGVKRGPRPLTRPRPARGAVTPCPSSVSDGARGLFRSPECPPPVGSLSPEPPPRG